ncbi:hypothetical protein ANCDUO_05205 [Ancylostoma duodenale]|uniref:Medium-chain acyl-CoA ligase ACSF2, mitochondrial n=1 Tax=Ancylostoma duodenale TaxID=51022 RepID=A0A0C2D4R5_9BILA|nr:hypothetical protein ANCDUO_05205 [Ancylostoma duodenale]
MTFQAERLASGLIHLGIEKGDRVGIWGPNTYEWITVQLATALGGMVLTPDKEFVIFKREEIRRTYHQVLKDVNINPCYQSEELRFALGKVGIKALITQPGFKKSNYYESLRGTTGQPKGATLTHHNVLNNAYFIGIRAGYHEQKTIICVPNPLYHCFGCVLGVLCALTHLQTCVFPAPSFEALAAIQAIDEERCTALYGTPTMFIDMLNHPDFLNYNFNSIRSGDVTS